MKKSTITFIFLLFQILAFGQNKLVKDIDNDGVEDTVYVDSIKSRIVCELSTNNFKPILSRPIDILNFSSDVAETGDGFEFFNNWMRAGYSNQFRYNSKTKKIQLIEMSRYEFGDATNDGSGESSVNLLTGNYIGNWNYYDSDKYELIKMPTIATKMHFKTINLEDFGEDSYFSYAEKCAELYHKYKKINLNKK